MTDVLASPMFGLILTVLAYDICSRIQKRWKSQLLNPIITASGLIGLYLTAFHIPYSTFNNGGSMISFFLGPLTVSLALPLYRQRSRILRYFVPLILGITVSVFASALSVMLFTVLFGFDERLFSSLLPKSLTNPIAAALSTVIGGDLSLTVAFVIITGITGVLTAPFLFTLLRIEHPVAKGTGLGSASHALGTARAFGYGETEGGISGVSIGLAGLISTLLMPFFVKLYHMLKNCALVWICQLL